MGDFHLVWCQLQRKEGRTDVWYTASRDGRTWDKPQSITNRGIDWAPTIYEDAKGVLRILWSSRRSGSRDIWMTRSLDGGKTWLSPDQVTRSSEEDDFPHALQASSGEHYLVSTRYRRGSAMLELHKDRSSDVVLATSRDAVVWSAPVVSSFGDSDNKFVDILRQVFQDPDKGQVFVSWTSGRTGARGDILARSVTSPSSQVFQLTRSDTSDYSAKIVPTAAIRRILDGLGIEPRGQARYLCAPLQTLTDDDAMNSTELNGPIRTCPGERSGLIEIDIFERLWSSGSSLAFLNSS